MLTLPCAYLPPIEWFALLQHGDDVRVEVCDTYQKQTYRSRAHIASPTGVQVLTVPVKHGLGTRGDEVMVSEQGNWRHLHLQALRSAYQMTPYYDYYADELEAFYQPGRYPTLYGFNLALARWLAHEMGVERPIETTTQYMAGAMAAITPKFRSLETSKHRSHESSKPRNVEASRLRGIEAAKPYYQVFSQRTGFLPGLSAIDLLMNMGPESIFYL